MVTLDIAKKYRTIEEYFEMEDASPVRHEFNNGEIKEMAGGILPHNVAKGEVYTLINNAIKRAQIPHMILNSDTKIRLEATNRFVYPDNTISDGTPEYYLSPEGKLRRDAIINPLVIIEVLSEDTRSYDKEEKFEEYCTVPTFREYILIEPERVWVKSMFLSDPANGVWLQQILKERKGSLKIHSLNLSIPLEEIYSAVDRLPK